MRTCALFLALMLTSPLLAEEEFKELFNGKDLAGWDGDERIWSVEDGLLTGQTKSDTNLKSNTFAIWKDGEEDGEVGDFELKAEFRIEGDNNSGIQYRSKRNPKNGKWSVVGYQGDIHPADNYAGMLYDEGGRGILAERGQKIVVSADGAKETTEAAYEKKPLELGAWHTLEITAKGPVLEHKLDSKVTVSVIDEDRKEAEARGILALQVHAGPPMKVQYKSVKLRRLDGDGPAVKP